MNRKWWNLIFVLPIFLCILYAGGYIAQFICNYKVWTVPATSPVTAPIQRHPPCTRWHAYQHWLTFHITYMGFFFAFSRSDY